MEQKFPKSEGVWMKSQIQILNSQETKNKKNPPTPKRVEKSEKLTSHSIPLEDYH